MGALGWMGTGQSHWGRRQAGSRDWKGRYLPSMLALACNLGLILKENMAVQKLIPRGEGR